MKKQILSMMLLISTIIVANAQTGNVGINTTNPQATLDVTGVPADPLKLDGIIAPRLTGDELSGKNYTTTQTGALVYATTAASSFAGQVINVTASGYYYFDGTVWVKIGSSAAGKEPWYNQATNTEATANTQNIYQMGNVAVGKTNNLVGTALDVEGAVRGGSLQSGTVGQNSAAFGLNNSAVGNMAVALGGSNQSNAVGSLTAGFGNITSSQYEVAIGRWNAITTGGTNSSFVATDPAFQIGASAVIGSKVNAMTVLKNGNTGIGIAGAEAAAKPTEMLDIGSGNLRVRDINTNVGVGTTDRVVVADTNGVLKTLDFGSYTLFHARLAASQNLAANTITSLLLAVPLATSPIYSYNTGTGVMTFNQAGNYLVTMQASFTNISAGTQLLMGIRPFPDAPYLGRGSHYNAVTNNGAIGELMNYTTMIIVPSAGYQVRFVAVTNSSSTVLATETGGTGSGNVTNVTVQKI